MEILKRIVYVEAVCLFISAKAAFVAWLACFSGQFAISPTDAATLWFAVAFGLANVTAFICAPLWVLGVDSL